MLLTNSPMRPRTVKSIVISDEVRKANEDIAPRISSGELTALNRKLYSYLMFRAQETGAEGMGGLPLGVKIAGELDSLKYWWIPLGDLIRDVRYNSNNYNLIKNTLEGLQAIRVSRVAPAGSARSWVSQHLIGTVRIDQEENSNRLWVGFNFPVDTVDQILNPSSHFTKLSIFYLSQLKTEAGIVLYETCRRYLTSPGEITPDRPWQDWAERMSTRAAQDEYKYFKRDVIKKGMKEVNDCTNLQVDLIEHKIGKSIYSIQFTVKIKPQNTFTLDSTPLFSEADTITMLSAELGISDNDAAIYCSGPHAKIIPETVALVKARMADSNQPRLGSPAAYFKKALLGEWVDGNKKMEQAVREKAEAKAKEAAATTAETESTARVKQDKAAAANQKAIDGYLAQPEAERAAVADTYIGSGAVGSSVNTFSKALAGGDWSKPTMKLFASWLAAQS